MTLESTEDALEGRARVRGDVTREPLLPAFLDEERSRRAMAIVEEVARAVSKVADFRRNPAGLATGQAGILLFLAYARKAGVAGFELEELIDACLSAEYEQNTAASFADGVVGVGWVCAHLPSVSACRDMGAVTEDLDAALVDAFRRNSDLVSSHGYELLYGAVGIGIYLLERLGEWPGAVPLLEALVNQLHRAAVADGRGTYWYSPQTWREDGYLDFGTAHGIPGIIGFLASALSVGIEVERSRELLLGALDWLHCEFDWSVPGPALPAWRHGQVTSRARFGWCYSDLGAVLPIGYAAKLVGHDAAQTDVRTTVARLVAPPPPKMDESGLCHGTAGIAHILRLLASRTGDDRLRDLAFVYFDSLLQEDLLTFELSPPAHGPGFLTGASGIALALLSAASDVGSAWDRCLLLSPSNSTGDAG